MFDINAYAEGATPVRIDDLDFAAFRDHPLPPEVLRCLRFMHDVESHTVCYLRDLLVTPSHRDPRITTFLTMWVYEEHWHGQAIGQVLAAHGEIAGPPRIERMRRGLGTKDRFAPIVNALAAGAIGEDFVAVHMTWGAINEWSTRTGYARLVELAPHPVLTGLLTRIMRQESRHIAFYASEARNRLARSKRARTLTRIALKRFWTPVGSGVMPATETEFLLRYLLDGTEGVQAIEDIDRHVDRLPGLAGLHLVRRAASSYGLSRAA